MAAPRVLIGIVSYRSGGHLMGCLESIFALRDAADVHVCVVDNAPGSGDGRAARSAFPGVRLIESPENEGYGAGMNRAFASEPSDCFLALNPDTRVLDGALDALAEALARDPGVAAVGPRLVYPDNRPQPSARRFPTLALALLEATDLNLRFPRNSLRRRHTYEGAAGGGARQVDWLNGAALMVRSDAFRRLGGFDRRFFMYYEEVDLCRRIRRSGMKVALVPGATVVHHRAHSTSGTDVRQVAFYESLCRYFRIHHGLPADLILRAALLLWQSIYLSAVALRYLPAGDTAAFRRRAVPAVRLARRLLSLGAV